MRTWGLTVFPGVLVGRSALCCCSDCWVLWWLFRGCCCSVAHLVASNCCCLYLTLKKVKSIRLIFFWVLVNTDYFYNMCDKIPGKPVIFFNKFYFLDSVRFNFKFIYYSLFFFICLSNFFSYHSVYCPANRSHLNAGLSLDLLENVKNKIK